MTQKFSKVYSSVIEKDEHKKSKEYKKLSPKMRDAIDIIFQKMDFQLARARDNQKAETN